MRIEFGPVRPAAQKIITDSRFVTAAHDSIFFAINGVNHNGHEFIHDLYAKGVREFCVETGNTFQLLGQEYQVKPEGLHTNAPEAATLPCTFWIVPNAIAALQEMAKWRRVNFHKPVVGITGSNGKTIVKEWLSQLISPHKNIVKSPRSYNSQLGVALSAWQIQPYHDLGIFEAGISKQGEMQALATILRPTLGIFTTIGSAHDEGFRSKKQKISEKLRLFQKSDTLVFHADQSEVTEEINLVLTSVNPTIRLIGWSFQPGQIYQAKANKEGRYTHINLTYGGLAYAFTLPFSDDASIENAIHCAYACLCLGYDTPTQWQMLAPRFLELKSVAMRLELKQGKNDTYVIDDTYNNDLGGLEMALNFLSQQQTQRRKVLILSDIIQSGLPEPELYERVGKLLESKGITQFIGVGGGLLSHQPIAGTYFPTTDELLAALPELDLRESIILVKGARKFAFERIVQRLAKRTHGTVLETNLDAVTHNLNFYRSKLKPATRLMAMVKAQAYGSGSSELATLLQYHRVDYLGVAYPDEGVALRQNGITLPIMVMNAVSETWPTLLEHTLEPEVYSMQMLEELLEFLQEAKPASPLLVHIKLDTGMHRLGFIESEISDLSQLIANSADIRIASVFSHLVGADEAMHNDFSRNQIEQFTRMAATLQQAVAYPLVRHICNSAGIIRFPDAHFDMVRLGIGLYGIEATGEEQRNLRVVGRLKTTISQIKELPKGDTVGYSRKGLLNRNSRIATIAIGYADGFDRGFSKGVGEVAVHGQLCPVIGNVCMDMTMIDVTDVDCQVGDEVIIFGEKPTLQQLAAKIDTIPYEILATIADRVKRVFYKE